MPPFIINQYVYHTPSKFIGSMFETLLPSKSMHHYVYGINLYYIRPVVGVT